MTKFIISAFGASICCLCVVVTLTAFAKYCEPLLAILAVIFAFSALSFIVWGLEGTKVADYMSEFFAEEGGQDE